VLSADKPRRDFLRNGLDKHTVTAADVVDVEYLLHSYLCFYGFDLYILHFQIAENVGCFLVALLCHLYEFLVVTLFTTAHNASHVADGDKTYVADLFAFVDVLCHNLFALPGLGVLICFCFFF
jgi:hypothetical protein